MYGETFYGRHTAQHQLQWSQISIQYIYVFVNMDGRTGGDGRANGWVLIKGLILYWCPCLFKHLVIDWCLLIKGKNLITSDNPYWCVYWTGS